MFLIFFFQLVQKFQNDSILYYLITTNFLNYANYAFELKAEILKITDIFGYIVTWKDAVNRDNFHFYCQKPLPRPTEIYNKGKKITLL